MRKPEAAALAAGKSSPAERRGDAPIRLICLALSLALLVLAARIASIW